MKEVTFNAVMCCALAQSFGKHSQLIAVWLKEVGPLKSYSDILVRTLTMSFTPSIEIAEVHRSFALAERERLATCGWQHGLKCVHTPADHIKALDDVIRQLPTVH